MLKAVRDSAPAEGGRHRETVPPEPGGRHLRDKDPPDRHLPRCPSWPDSPRMVEEDHGSPLGFRTRRVPDSPELAELTETAIRLGHPRAV